jgi:ATP-dependent exoDNAse (exonuclease V) beta subunit
LPFTSDGDSAAEVFERSKLLSPDPARSKREWQMLRDHLASSTDFRRRISADLTHREMPFFWKIDDSKCLEGIVDLALFNHDASKALLLDWKTNRIAPDKIDNLRARYRAQMAAYWQAVTQLTGASIDAGIYSTSTGQFLAYELDELATEWERLRTLPLNDLARELESDDRVSNRARHG